MPMMTFFKTKHMPCANDEVFLYILSTCLMPMMFWFIILSTCLMSLMNFNFLFVIPWSKG